MPASHRSATVLPPERWAHAAISSRRAPFCRRALPFTILAIRLIKPREIDVAMAHGGVPDPGVETSHSPVPVLLHKRPLLIFAACIMLFHLANSAMLPLMGSVLTTRSSQWATLLIAACIIVPQCVVAISRPGSGASRSWDAGPAADELAAMPLRGLLLRSSTAELVVAVQLLDG
jgi:hypothetical protein